MKKLATIKRGAGSGVLCTIVTIVSVQERVPGNSKHNPAGKEWSTWGVSLERAGDFTLLVHIQAQLSFPKRGFIIFHLAQVSILGEEAQDE